MKRILLLIATNLAVMFVLSIIVSVLGVDRWLMAEGIDYFSLLVFSAVFGFGGAFISLLMSKTIARMSVGAQVIDGSEGTTQYWLVRAVPKVADAPDVGPAAGAIDPGAASVRGAPEPRSAALSRRGGVQSGGLPDGGKPCGIASEWGLGPFSAPPPPIEARIAALQNPQ